MGAPVHRLHPLVDKALFGHLAKHLHLLGFKMGLQREVGIVPLSQHAQALELLPLLVHKIEGVLLALLPKLGGGERIPLHLFVFQDGGFDGQAVGVPAGDIGGAVARHVFLFDDDILEDLVQRGTDVDVSVGVGRPVVEDEEGFPVVAGDHLVVEVLVIHRLEHLWLAPGEPRPHGEIGLGQVDGLIIVHVLRSPFLFCSASRYGDAHEKTPLSLQKETKALKASAVPLFLPRTCRGPSHGR